jgi:hypothetical protein
MVSRVIAVVAVSLWASLGCQEEAPVSPEPADQAGCVGRNEAQCEFPCSAIKSRRPDSTELEFMECVANEVGGSTAITCALSPDQSECRLFPTTLIAIQWRQTPCNHPVCTGLDAGLDAGDATTPALDASPIEMRDANAPQDATSDARD